MASEKYVHEPFVSGDKPYQKEELINVMRKQRHACIARVRFHFIWNSKQGSGQSIYTPPPMGVSTQFSQIYLSILGAGLNDGLFSETMDFRDFPSVLSAVRIHSQLQGSSARPSHFLDAETCEFPSLSMLPV